MVMPRVGGEIDQRVDRRSSLQPSNRLRDTKPSPEPNLPTCILHGERGNLWELSRFEGEGFFLPFPLLTEEAPPLERDGTTVQLYFPIDPWVSRRAKITQGRGGYRALLRPPRSRWGRS